MSVKTLLRRVTGSDFARNGAIVFGAVIFGNAFNYLYYMLMARVLSVRDYGVAMSLTSGILLVLGIGVIAQTTVAKLAADLRAAGDEHQMAAFTRAISRLGAVAGLIIFIATLTLRGFFAGFLHLENPELVVVAGAAAGIGFALLLQRGLFQGFGAFKNYGISAVLDGVKAILLVPLAHAFGVMGAVAAFLAAIATGTAYGDFTLRRRVRGAEGMVRIDLRRLLLTAGATGVSSLGVIVVMYYDVVLAKHYLAPIEAGLYSAAALAGRVLLAATSFIPIVLLPETVIRSARGRSNKRVLGAALIMSGAIIGSVVAACWFAPKLVLYVIAGHAFSTAAPLLLPYVLAAAGLSLGNLLAVYAIARHRFGFVPYLLLTAACEISAVALRHGSAIEIVQDILVGHLTICLVMAVWLALDLARFQHVSRAGAVAGIE